MQTKYDLNLSDKYVKNWGIWEVGREIISNAIDADSTNYEVEVVDENCIRVFTNTCPEFGHIKVIGSGTKTDAGKTIGQFGEGFKLAALVCTRLGGKFNLVCAKFKASFHLEKCELSNENILQMEVEEGMPEYTGCDVYIQLDGIAEAVKGKFLTDSKIGPIKKDAYSPIRIYLKGVFVQEHKTESLFDWNLDSIEINRDRNVLSIYDCSREVIYWLNEHADLALVKTLLKAPASCFEIQAFGSNSYCSNSRLRTMFIDAVKEIHGTNIVLATDDSTANKIASAKGKTVVVLERGIMSVVNYSTDVNKIETSKQFLKHPSSFDKVEVDEYAKYEIEFNTIMEILEIGADIKIFLDYEGAALGEATKGVVWLNSKLFKPGMTQQRLATFIHELAHIKRGGDGTLEFEDSLDSFCGRLAVKILKSTRRRKQVKKS
ncbi:MAG TPA: hypothetical protein ENH82_09910 [bacterium]|nr:hypothetical protein [bacterium]